MLGHGKDCPSAPSDAWKVGSARCWAGQRGEDVKVPLPWEGWFRGSGLQSHPGNQESPGSGVGPVAWCGLGEDWGVALPVQSSRASPWVPGRDGCLGVLCRGGTPGSQGTSPHLQ